MEDLKLIIANNITRYRTNLGITQMELANMLNYSDKSVSKWERGMGIPDVIVLKKMSEVFGVTVDELLTSHSDEEKIIIKPDKKTLITRKVIITLLSVGLAWLVATLCYVALMMFRISGAWKCFIYAVPISFLVTTIFSAIWGKKWGTAIFVSFLIWTILGSIYLTFIGTRAWLLFIIGIPLQVLVVLWHLLMGNISKKQKKNIPTQLDNIQQ